MIRKTAHKASNGIRKKRLARTRHATEAGHTYESLIDEIAEGITLIDPAGHIQYVNKAAVNLLGLSKAAVQGKHFAEFVHPDSQSEAKAYFAQVIKGQAVRQGTINVRTKSKEAIPIEFSASAILRANKVVQVHAIFRDISDRVEMESVLRESERVAAIQHFIAGATQEIRNPLLGLSRHLEQLIKDFAKRDFEYIGFKEYKSIFRSLDAMYHQAKYCYETTERLLEISRRKIGINERYCDVSAAVHLAVDKVRYSAEAMGISLRTVGSPKIPQAAIGHIELTEILVNVLTNSIQSITHNGKIIVRYGKTKNASGVYIECIDNGIGISKADLSRVFDPFFTTKQRGLEKSSGLGLSIVHSIVQSHKGDVELKSSQREGTRVKITLPAKRRSS